MSSASILTLPIIKWNKGQFTSWICQILFICLFKKYLLSNFYVPCTVLSVWVVVMDETVKNPFSPGICFLVWKTGNK